MKRLNQVFLQKIYLKTNKNKKKSKNRIELRLKIDDAKKKKDNC